jgi:hypothetical protein
MARLLIALGDIILISSVIWFGMIIAVDVAGAQEPISPFCMHGTKELRSKSVLKKFDRATGYPRGRRGYIRDHKCPLACGGKDAVENLQWQTIKESRDKDKIERTPLGYSLFCEGSFENYGIEK